MGKEVLRLVLLAFNNEGIMKDDAPKAAEYYCYNFSYFALFTYDFSLFLEVSHGAAALTHFSLTHIAATLLTHCTAALTHFSLTHITATLLTHCTAVVLTHGIAILIALPHCCSIYSGQSCRLFFS